ncbi:hypothetical protein BGX38DRAFT_823939 [Terfezia claveryi]|nr:hypothetical protein BGX38DRAFT_823939 [Terfezia claveryi]
MRASIVMMKVKLPTYHLAIATMMPADAKCCTKTSCGDETNCRWPHQCSGKSLYTYAR